MKKKNFVEKVKKFWLPFYMAMFTVMVIAGQAISGDPLAKFENQNGNGTLGFVEMITKLGGFLFTFIDSIKGILLLAVILGFAWSIFGQIRGQQIDITEILKNLLIYGIAGGAIWFGPNFLRTLFASLDGSSGTKGATINENLLLENKIPSNLKIENGNYILE
jgi:hypothetical protein